MIKVATTRTDDVFGTHNGRRLVVSGAGPQLLQLVRLFGLSEVLVQAGGQAEQRKQAGGVEEVGDRRDPPG